MDPDFIMAKQVEQLEKEKKELQERLKNQEKKVQSRKDKKKCPYMFLGNVSCIDTYMCMHTYIILVLEMSLFETKER